MPAQLVKGAPVTPAIRLNLLEHFPYDTYPDILPAQREALELMDQHPGSLTLELPTGSGKTAIGYTFLKAMTARGMGPLFYVVPNKTLVEQVHAQHPDMTVAFGRNEHRCLYYPDENLQADEVPCLLLTDCPHRVHQVTGTTFQPGAARCPYYDQKFKAKQSQIVVCTTAFYLFTQLFSREWNQPAGVVFDEAHRLAHTVRGCLSYDITDYHLARAVKLLEEISAEEAEQLQLFLKRMIRYVKRKPPRQPTLLEPDEIRALMELLKQIDPDHLRANISRALREQKIDSREKREVLKKVETLSYNLRRYVKSFELALSDEDTGRNALNYTYAFYREEKSDGERVQYRLVIKGYYVAPLIRRMLGQRTLAYSATIGDPKIFGFETGIKAPCYEIGSTMPPENTRVFLPSNTPNLAMSVRIKQEPTKVLRRIAKACHTFAQHGHRSLVVVISDKERQKFLQLCAEENVHTVSYGNGVPPKEAAAKFKAGEGDVLVGTAANYGEGVDLPKQIAPIIFFLRPGYPQPNDPGTQFEEQRFGGMRWSLWNWRVMIEALQARGRNVRSSSDLGVTFFISQQFRRFLYSSLPEWLKQAYNGDSSFESAVDETLKLLSK